MCIFLSILYTLYYPLSRCWSSRREFFVSFLFLLFVLRICSNKGDEFEKNYGQRNNGMITEADFESYCSILFTLEPRVTCFRQEARWVVKDNPSGFELSLEHLVFSDRSAEIRDEHERNEDNTMLRLDVECSGPEVSVEWSGYLSIVLHPTYNVREYVAFVPSGYC